MPEACPGQDHRGLQRFDGIAATRAFGFLAADADYLVGTLVSRIRGFRLSDEYTDGAFVSVLVDEMKRSGRYYLSQTVKVHALLPHSVRLSMKQERRLLMISADACVGGLI
jgi:hypothetical protein